MSLNRNKWLPYLFLLPSLLYLLIFFAWPMVSSLSLAFWKDDSRLTVHVDPNADSSVDGTVPQASTVAILATQGNRIADADEIPELVDTWYFIDAVDADGNALTGWVRDTRIRVEETEDGSLPTAGSIRTVRRSGADPQTSVYAEPGSDNGEVLGKLDARTDVTITEQAILEVWYQISWVSEEGDAVEGWVLASNIVPGEQDPTQGFVQRGNMGEWTLDHIERMVTDRFFQDAFVTTLGLAIIIIPIQFVVALAMALVIQAQLKGSTFFLYIYTIPLAVSELAVGIVFFLIFSQSGYINSLLVSTGLLDNPYTFISVDTRYWIFIAIVLAEVWRATSIVMVILVSGLQSIPAESLEAAELFGAHYWQRVRHIILPLLRPSIQVALILRTILAFQVFAVVIAISGGEIMTTLARETYRWYSGDILNPHIASAYGGLIMLVSLIISIFYLRAVRSQEETAS